MFVELTSEYNTKRDVNMLLVAQIKYCKDYTTLDFADGSQLKVMEDKKFLRTYLEDEGMFNV